jgi:UDP-2,3-diacylglucosamine hydrolase
MSSVLDLPLDEGALVIADLHLDVEDEPSLEPFLNWLGQCEGIPQLLILGDLFEFWVGPVQLELPGAARVVGALAQLQRSGTRIDVVPGNRDFLLGPGFESHSGARVHMGGLVGVLGGGGRVLFIHGDELATDDVAYMRLRRVLRSRAMRFLAPRLPRALSFRLASRLRGASKNSTSRKAPLSMKLNLDACQLLASRHRATTVVCGHAHRFQEQVLPNGGRFVILDAYGGPRGVLRVGAEERLDACGLDANS